MCVHVCDIEEWRNCRCVITAERHSFNFKLKKKTKTFISSFFPYLAVLPPLADTLPLGFLLPLWRPLLT